MAGVGVEVAVVLDQLGEIPTPGQMCTVDGWRLEVVAMERLRIASVRVVAPPEVAAAEPGDVP